MAVFDEIITLLGLQVDPKAGRNAKKFEASLTSVSKAAAKAGVALVALRGAVAKWSDDAIQAVAADGRFAESMGVSYEAMQEWGYAVTQAGGDAKAFQGDLDGLTKSMASPIPGEFNSTLALLGISVRKSSGELRSADAVMGDLSKKFDGLNKVEAQQLGSKIGLSPATIKLFQQGSATIADLRAEARALGGIIPESDVEDAKGYVNALNSIKFAVQGISRTAAVSIAPVFKDALVSIQRFLSANRELIKTGLADFALGVAKGFGRFFDITVRVGEAVAKLLAPFGDLITNFDTVEVIAGLVAAVLAAVVVSALAAAAPFIAMGAAVGVALLAIEDFLTFLEGGDSIIGRFVESAKAKVGELVEDFKARFPALADFLGQVFDDMTEGIKAAFDVLFAYVTGLIDSITGVAGKVTDTIKGLGTGALDALDDVAASFGFGGDDAATGAPAAVAGPQAFGPISMGGGGAGGNTTVNVEMKSTGSTAGDIAKVKRGLSDVGMTSQIASPGLFAPVAG